MNAEAGMLNERKIIWLLCLVAAIHVLVFSAAFPFFNNVDELAHFDLVVKYSHGHVPHGLETFSPEAAEYMSLYSSGTYFGKASYFANGQFPPPPWKQPFEQVRAELFAEQMEWQKAQNYEASEPPLYYALAGLGWRAEGGLGLQNGELLYALRFLNILIIAGMVWLGYVAGRMLFPENSFIRRGVPAMLAFFPQTAFYSIENDALCPLVFGAVFVLLIKWWRAENPGPGLAATLGLALAATFLTKMTNLPLLAVSGIAISIKTWTRAKSGKGRAVSPLGLLLLCAALPASWWVVWCKIHYGDLTGSELKASFFGWTIKPFWGWWHHPIFRPAGFWTFISSLIATFWQSEFLWHAEPLHLAWVDLVYVILSIACLGAVLPSLVLRSQSMLPAQRQALWLSFWCFVTAISYLAFLSIIFDFGDGHNPSRARPYFTAGRMILGALIPFLILYLYGLERMLARLRIGGATTVALVIMILFMLATEVAVDWPVFSNEYNWFHM